MSFKFLLISLFSLLIFSCGVKTVPLKPSETIIDSYVESYTHESEKDKDNDKKKFNPAESINSEKK
ncbi:MAG: hypothetical protein HOP07_09440 [Bacteriovoracaceae bacterium]|nr:hypothetical protein [Bacteriovoracaceae bacterium]